MQIRLLVAGLLCSIVSKGQNVGIGVSNPFGLLHIRGGSTWSKLVLENEAGQPMGFVGADANGTITLAANAFWNGSNWQYPASGSSLYMLLHRANNRFEFRVRPDGQAERTAMTINMLGQVGIGVGTAQQMLAVGSGLVVDQNSNNTGTFDFGLSFGNNSSEGIASKRNAGGNQFGLDFYTNRLIRMSITNVGQVGIGTTNPQQMLAVAGGTVIDQLDQNFGTKELALQFGSNSGEAIGSRRTAGTNRFGLDFYTGSANRMTITNAGNVGIGTITPQAPLEIAVGNNRSVRFKNETIPTLELVSGNTGDALAGIMRLRNAMEVWPSADGSRAGKLDVRNNGGGVTISLNGADGTITANNLPAFRRQSTNRATTQLGQGGSAVLESFKVVIPASGLVKISAKVFMYPTGNHNIAQRLEINDNTPGQFNTLATRQYILPQSYAGDFEIVWVGNLPTGNRLLELKLYNSSTVNWDITYHVSSIDVTYIGKQLDTW